MRTLKRPQNIAELKELMSRSSSPESEAAGKALAAVASDVFISTFAKSGTTWMQQVVHQLRCDADELYEDIYEVVPWLEMALVMKTDPAAPQRGDFRAYKTHLSYKDLPEPGRYISVFREPTSVVPSFYRFLGGWYFDTAGVSLGEFARNIYLPYFEGHKNHFVQWYERKDEENTLLLTYEDMLMDPDRVPHVVAEFLGLTLDATTMEKVIRHCSRQYMVEHEAKFGDRLVRLHQDSDLGLPPDGESSKVFQHKSDSGLSPELLLLIESLWREQVGEPLGFNDYHAMRRALPNPLNVDRP